MSEPNEINETGMEKRPYHAPQVNSLLEPFKQWGPSEDLNVKPVKQCKFKLLSDLDKGCIAGLVTCIVDKASLDEIGMTADQVANVLRGDLVPQMEQRLAVSAGSGLKRPAHIGLVVKIDDASATSISEASCDD